MRCRQFRLTFHASLLKWHCANLIGSNAGVRGTGTHPADRGAAQPYLSRFGSRTSKRKRRQRHRSASGHCAERIPGGEDHRRECLAATFSRCLWHPPGCSRPVFQFVREHADEAIIICWVPAEVLLSLLARKENRLQGSSTAVCLDPAVYSFVHCASPNSYRIGSQSRVGQFKHDAANIFVCEEVIPCELHVIEIAVYVEKERIAAPTKEKAVARGFRHQSL